MEYIPFEQLQTIVVDFTSYCNSSCGNCSRNIMGVDINPNMPLQHMTVDTWKRLMTVENVSQISEIMFNGAYGDCIMNPNLFECLEHLLTLTDELPSIRIDTNGGICDTDYWRDLAILLNNFPKPTHVTFSIDGLEDTNHLYRRNVNFNKVMENSKSFIDNGGWARWRTLIFEHNKHQIDDMRKLSETMGFLKFDINGGTHTQAINFIVGEAREYYKKNKKQDSYEVVYAFNQHENKLREKLKQYNSLDEVWNSTNIKCQWSDKRMIQISHMGEVWPCCYFLAERYPKDNSSIFYTDILRVLENNEIDFNNINKHSLRDILNTDFFVYELTRSWNNVRYQLCPRNCSI